MTGFSTVTWTLLESASGSEEATKQALALLAERYQCGRYQVRQGGLSPCRSSIEGNAVNWLETRRHAC